MNVKQKLIDPKKFWRKNIDDLNGMSLKKVSWSKQDHTFIKKKKKLKKFEKQSQRRNVALFKVVGSGFFDQLTPIA